MNQKSKKLSGKSKKSGPKKSFSSKKTSSKKPFSGHRKEKPKNTMRQPKGIAVLITVIDVDGDVYGLPQERALVGEYPRLRLIFKGFSGIEAPSVGDVVIVDEPKQHTGDEFTAIVVGKPQEKPEIKPFLAEFQEQGSFAYVRPMLKELSGTTFKVESLKEGVEQPQTGDVVRASAVGHYGKQGSTPVEIVEVLGLNPKGLESSVAIDNFNIRYEWPQDVIQESEALKKDLQPSDLSKREDLRTLPLVTIDGADARDFDDAVWAEETATGFHIIVAIADVAHYVQKDSLLDIEALKRGNSTYFPDRVVPMLPERLSNDLCSLRPHEDRPVMAVHLYIDEKGRLEKFKFSRAVIHSHARLTYEQAQEALNGHPDAVAERVLETTLQPLFKAYKVLWKARQRRHAIDLDIPESTLLLDEEGDVSQVGVRERLDAHKLIEEMMILANVAAARALRQKGAPCLYRIHPEPDGKKLDILKAVMQPHGIGVPKTAPTQQDYQTLVQKVHGHPAQAMLMKSILQSQMQAKYSVDNVGHFGLSLPDYAHFTSPIRRYADLVVHRSLIEFLELSGEGGVQMTERQMTSVADNINDTERRSQKAEWEARDRLMTKFYQNYIGEEFVATVVTVMKYGCFVSIQDGVAEGLLPMRLMDDDHYTFDEKKNQLKGKRTKRSLKVGDQLKVKLHEADRVEGRLTFRL